MTDVFERIATSVPLSAEAARVTSKGTAYVPDLRAPTHILHSAMPLPMLPPPRCENARHIVGRRVGRLTVIGYSASQNPKKNASWVVRCACGNYETRKSKAIFNPANTKDRCTACRHLESSKRRYAFFGARPLNEMSTHRAQGIVTGTAETSEAQAPVPKGLEPGPKDAP